MKIRQIHHFLFRTLRGRLILSVALVHAVMMSLFVADLTLRQRAMLLDLQEEFATALSRSLATSAATWLAADDIAGLQELVEAQRRYPELTFALLADAKGQILAHTDSSKHGLYLADLPQGVQHVLFARTPALVDAADPAMLAGRHVGWARIGIGQKEANQQLTEITRNGVLYALVAIASGGWLAWLIGGLLSRRLHEVQLTINEVKAGNPRARSKVSGDDEAARLAQEFNAMLEALAERDAELHASEANLRHLIEDSPVAIMVTGGADNRIQLVNHQYTELLGYTRADTPDMAHWWPLITPAESYRTELMAEWAARMEQVERRAVISKPLEATLNRKDGAQRRVEFYISKINARVLITLVDVTERNKAKLELRKSHLLLEEQVKERTAELQVSQSALLNLIEDQNERAAELARVNKKLQELDRLKSMFIASMSHELRTPLNAIIGFTGILLQGMVGELNAKQKEHLERVQKSGQHLLMLISDVIDISKIEAGRTEVLPAEVLLDEVVSEAIDAVRLQIKNKGLSLHVELQPGVPLVTDRRRFLQCLLNFLSNAVKFTEQGDISVRARAFEEQVEVEVSDTGIGISAEDRPKLFQAFERIESHLQIQAGGAGLGLYLTKKIATDLLKGEVAVTSSQGQGSSFTLRVPRRLPPTPAQETPLGEDAPHGNRTGH